MRYYVSLMKNNYIIWKTFFLASIIIFLLAQLAVSTAKTSDFAFQSVAKDVPNQSAEIDWWPMFQHDPEHSGYSSAAAPNNSETRFIVNYTRSHNSYASPIVVNNKLIIPGGATAGGYNYSLYAINASSGKLLWRSSLSFSSDATPAAFGDRVVIPSSNGYLYSFDITDGVLVWKYHVSDGGYGNLPSPIIVNGIVFHAVGTTNVAKERGQIYAISLFDMENSTTPKLIWKRPLNSIVTSSPAYSNGRVLLSIRTYNGGQDSYVVSLNATDGSQVWNHKLSALTRSSPTVADGKVYVGSGSSVYCLSETTGELLWMAQLWTSPRSQPIDASLAVANGRVFVGTFAEVVVHAKFYSLNASNGETIWEYQVDRAGESIASSPAVANGKVFVCAGRRIYAFNETNGSVVWAFETTGYSGGSSPAVALNSVYVQDQEGYVYCFGSRLYFMITIDPSFYDNRGEPLVPPPSLWTILFPNGTTIKASDLETHYVPMGTYSIKSAFWKGFEVLRQPVSVLLDSNMTWSPRIDCILPTDISISLSSSTSYIGFQVGIEGNLTCNEVGVSDAGILLSYSVTSGGSWNDITFVNTSPDGSYSSVWMPSATGNYLVRAIWEGNSTYPRSSTIVSLAVTLSEGKNVFAVESNSTISDLTFDTTSRRLSFNVSGENNTIGYSKVTIAKTLISDVTKLKIRIDRVDYNYTVIETDDSWILTFTYTHSFHHVILDLQTAITTAGPFDPILICIMVTVIVIALISGIILVKRRKSKSEKRH